MARPYPWACPRTALNGGSLLSLVVPASCANSSLRKTCGSMIGVFTSLAMSVIRLSAHKTEHLSSRSPNAQYGKRLKDCQPSPPCEVELTFSCPVSKRYGTLRHLATSIERH